MEGGVGLDCDPFNPCVWGEGVREYSVEKELSESVVELRLEGRVRDLGWVEGVEYCPVLFADLECDEVVCPIVPGAATCGYRMLVLVGVAGEEVVVTLPSLWGLPEIKHLVYFLLMQKGD